MPTFKQKLQSGEKLCGLWLGTASGYMAELAAQSGFDWYLIDGEHGPNTIQTMADQLLALDAYNQTSMVRVLNKDVNLVKQVLDIGARAVLVPMVDTREEAELMVRACRYPPAGIRGVGGYLIRAALWGHDPDYARRADEEICIITQCESRAGLENLDEILTIESLDGVFIGPADLSANYGFASMTDPTFTKMWFDAIARIKAAGKFAGTLTPNREYALKSFEAGADFVAVEVDVTCYLSALKQSLAQYKTPATC